MSYQFEVNAEVKQFLNEHFAAPIQQLLYEHCTAALGAARRSLLEHLVNTAGLLKKWECEEYLWRAGVFHSIYGSEGVFSVPMSLERREEIQSMIGSKSEHLAYLFCTMSRVAFYDNLDKTSDYFILDRFNMTNVALSKHEYIDLLTLTLADWIEPIVGKQSIDRQLEQYVKRHHRDDFTKASRFLPEKAVRDLQLVYGIN